MDPDRERRAEVSWNGVIDDPDGAVGIVEVLVSSHEEVTDLRLLRANPAFLVLAQLPGDAVGRRISTMLGRPNLVELGRYRRAAVQREEQRFEVEAAAPLHGRSRATIRPVDDPARRLVEVSYRPVTERSPVEPPPLRSDEVVLADPAGFRRLYDLHRRLLSEIDLGRGLDAVLVAACAFSRTDRGDIQLVRDDGRRLEVVAWHGYPAGSPVIRSLAHEAPVQVDMVWRDPARQSDLRAASYSTPIVGRSGEPLGVLSTQVGKPDWLSDGELRLVEMVSSIAAEYIERHRASGPLRESEAHQAFLLSLSDALRPLTEPAAILDTACRLLGEHLETDRAYYVSIDRTTRTATVERDYVRNGGPSLAGRHPIESFTSVLAGLEAGDLYIEDDVTTSPRVTDEDRPVFAALRIGSFADAPIIKDGVLVAAMCATNAGPRRWTAAEVAKVKDVTERTWEVVERARVEQALRASEEKYRTLVQNIHDYAIFLLDAHGLVTSWSEGAERVTGYHPDEVLGQHLSMFYPPEDVAAGVVDRELARAAATGRVENESWRIRKGGERFWSDEIATAIRDEAGRLVGFTKITRDLTERRQAEAAVRDNASRQSFLVRLSDTLARRDASRAVRESVARMLGEYLDADRAYYSDVRPGDDLIDIQADYARAGLPSVAGQYAISAYFDGPSELRDGRPLVVADISTEPSLSDATRAALAAHGYRAFVAAPLIANGDLTWTLNVISLEPREWSAQEVALVAEVGGRTWEAIQLAEAESSLRESEERYRSLFEGIDQGFYRAGIVRDAQGRATDFRFLEVNPAFFRVTGFSRPTPVGMTMREIMPSVEEEWIAATVRTVMTGQSEYHEGYVAAVDRWFEQYVTARGDDQVVALITDVTDRKGTEAARERARQVAERAVVARDRFLSIGAHELRTPITGLKGTANLMQRSQRRGTLTPERLDRYLGALVEASERLEAMVGDLFDVARLRAIDAGQPDRHRVPVDLAELVGETVRQHWRRGQLSRLVLDLQHGPALALDQDRIRQVVVNLVENGLKYSPEQESVYLDLRQDEDGATIRVRDAGIGLPRSAIETVFEPFNRAPNAAESSIPGLGLGLYICREIIHAHGGQIRAESAGEGQGTTMVVWLPANPPPNRVD